MAPDNAKITLYWLEQSRAQRIVWLLEELKLDYHVETFPRVNKLAPPELKKIHPLGKSPLVGIERAGRDKPLILAESGFITEYLVGHYGPHLAPAKFSEGVAATDAGVGEETESWLRYQHLLHFAEGSMMPFLVMKLVTENIRTAPVPFFIKPVTSRVAGGVESQFVHPNIEANLAYLEELLSTSPGGGRYLCGDQLTAADILMSFPVLAAKVRLGIDASKFPKLVAYANLLEKEPGYVAAVKKIEAIDGKEYSIVQ